MASEKKKTNVSYSGPVKQLTSLQNFSDFIEAEDKSQLEEDNQRKELKAYKSSTTYPTDRIPIQIRLLQAYKENLRNRQLKPSYVQWLCSDICQFYCDHSDIHTVKSSSKKLSTENMIKTLDTLSFLGCDIFSVIGGDPFLREDLFDILSYAKGRGIKIALTTHNYDIENHFHEIEQAKLDSIMVSLDGYRAHHDRIKNRPGDYETCLNCLQAFYDMDIPVIGVSVVVMDENVHHIPKIVDDIYNYGGNRIQIQPLLSKKRNRPQIVKEALRQIYYSRLKGFNIEASEGFGYLGYMETLFRSSYFFCGCGWDTFTIMPDGKIIGCAALNTTNHSEGNIIKDELQEIWFSRFHYFRRDTSNDLPMKCKNCKYVEICRGGCWLFRACNQDPCFLPQAEELMIQIFG